ncbi:MAG: 5'/3'-nucleotidase SurE, partial [Schwartzia sp.]|nr:5'/3'-nucleotidase SurE [Schwartzia sp. (in: firmicutes)]
MRILISNDDGIEAEGLQALAKALAGPHEVVLAAPARQQSGMAHALTVHSDIEAAQYKDLESMGITGWKIDGTP